MLLRAALLPPPEAVDELEKALRALMVVPGVTPVGKDQIELPITAFGNLQPDDCARLARVLRTAIEGAEAPSVSFEGVRLEDDGTIAVGLAGEVDPLADLARFVPEAAEQLRLFVDRRRFRLAIKLASVGAGAPSALLEATLSRVANWSGTPWAVPGLSLVRTRWAGGESRSEEYALIRFV